MKRFLAILLALTMLFAFAACGAKTEETETEPTTEGTTTWKSVQANYKFNDVARLVFFQNYINFNKDVAEDGSVVFPDFGEAVTGVEMKIAGETVKAYSLGSLFKIWCTEPTGTLTIVDGNGKEYTAKAEDLKTAFVGEYETTIDGLAANKGVLKIGKLEIKDVKYILTESKDAFMFATTGESATDSPIKLAEVFAEIGWDTDLVYKFVCFDNYWNFIDSQETKATGKEDGAAVLAGTELRATLSGALNISIPFENRGGSGKMNDIFYVAITEPVA